jgi:MFS family permease
MQQQVEAAAGKAAKSPNSPARILFASLIGTAIEYFDFYIFGTAAVLVFPKLFFASSDPAMATLQSLATFGLAFIARPVGSALFGHFGDRIGRKATLVASLLTMGLSTVLIGLLPTYASIGILAPTLLAARCCWPPRMRRRASAPGMACSRSWAARPASSCPARPSCT